MGALWARRIASASIPPPGHLDSIATRSLDRRAPQQPPGLRSPSNRFNNTAGGFRDTPLASRARSGDFGLGDELQDRGAAGLGGGDGAVEGGHDLGGLGDALAPGAQGASHRSVIAALSEHAVPLLDHGG